MYELKPTCPSAVSESDTNGYVERKQSENNYYYWEGNVKGAECAEVKVRLHQTG